jgi:hypothetical protein
MKQFRLSVGSIMHFLVEEILTCSKVSSMLLEDTGEEAHMLSAESMMPEGQACQEWVEVSLQQERRFMPFA